MKLKLISFLKDTKYSSIINICLKDFMKECH